MNEEKPWLFKKGCKAGPGRPHIPDSLKIYALSEGAGALLEIARNKKSKDRFDAIKLIFAYVYGQPKQQVDVSSESFGNSEEIRKMEERLDQLSGLAPKSDFGGNNTMDEAVAITAANRFRPKRSPGKGHKCGGKR